MEDNEEPIFDFAPLKQFLTERGYIIGTRSAYEPFVPEEVQAADVTSGKMDFRDDGIFVIDDNGVEHQVFLYKKDYRLKTYGKPRFHICKCQVIDDFINRGRFKEHYVRANTDTVPVVDLDNDSVTKQIKDLPLCRYCQKKISEDYGKTSSDFVEMLKSAKDSEQPEENLELDIFGYTKNWPEISLAIREKHNYTCENCGLHLDDAYARYYMQVHHQDGNKLNNSESNLKCLCLRCHAAVDANHTKKLTTNANGIMYRDFIERYQWYWDKQE
jgi:5-methylcytosine-specific restriction endonuclease McrA